MLILSSKINAMNREEGYYWVKFSEEEDWEIAYFKHGRWSIVGTDDSFDDSVFYRIDEQIIKKWVYIKKSRKNAEASKNHRSDDK